MGEKPIKNFKGEEKSGSQGEHELVVMDRHQQSGGYSSAVIVSQDLVKSIASEINLQRVHFIKKLCSQAPVQNSHAEGEFLC